MNLALGDPHLFEEEVRRIARYRWPIAEFGGAEMIDGRERDGVFETDDCLHLVEATTSRAKDKALSDLKKLYSLYERYRKEKPEKAIKCWFVTREDPTADQRSVRSQISGAPPNLFNIVSFTVFQSSLVDSKMYLQARAEHPFGSVYDPKSESATVDVRYIEVGLYCSEEKHVYSPESLADLLLSGGKSVLLGEFGVGKSMTLRETYRKLAAAYHTSKTAKFPIYINLREHHGQENPAEILERHARNIGFANPHQLVRAWKAGYVTLLIDGFDEVSSRGLQGAWRRFRHSRFLSMAGLRTLIQMSPPNCGIAVAGRENFFDTAEERRQALGQNGAWKELQLDEFTEEQAIKLIRGTGFLGAIPEWIPSRPLFLSTIFLRWSGFKRDSVNIHDVAEGWDALLTEVCNREARIEYGITGDNIRKILETLATIGRSRENQIGPLAPGDILDAFKQECGFEAADEALTVLQRLPGLSRDLSADDARCFSDVEFADACRAGDLASFAINPYDEITGARLRGARAAVGGIGMSVACLLLRRAGFNDGALVSVTRKIASEEGFQATAADAISLAVRLGLPIREKIFVSDLIFSRFEVDPGKDDLVKVTFTDCYFQELDLPSAIDSSSCPDFVQCLVQSLEGRVSKADLPAGRFEGCVIEEYSDTVETVSGVLQLDIPAGTRVLVTILKKLFVQSLGGRKENAFYRGLGQELQAKVPAVLQLIENQGLATRSGRSGEPLWIPVRRHRRRVLEIIQSPSDKSDPIISLAGSL